jgi:pimeloyl-ACP methyl ester carboxylesterase
VALYESGVISVAGEDVLAGFVAAVEQVGEAAADGRLADAARAFAPSVQTDSEIAALDADFFEQWGRSIPALIRLIQQAASYVGTRSTDPGTLRKITVPVLLLVGHETRQAVWFTEAAHHIAKHVADPEVRELPSIGHFAPVLAPEIIAQELIRFFESVRQPA